MDPAQQLVDEYRTIMDVQQQSYVEAYRVVRDNHAQLIEEMKIRSRLIGAPIIPRDGYFYRYELMLAGVHNHLVAGVTVGEWNGDPVATSIVAKHTRHNYLLVDVDGAIHFVYGGSGGDIEHAHRRSARRRVMADQTWTRFNQSLVNSAIHAIPVRVFMNNIHDIYQYCGMYMVIDWWVINYPIRPPFGPGTNEIIEFLLIRAADNVQAIVQGQFV